MCGRYTLDKRADDIAKRFNIATLPKNIRTNYNVAPSQVMPVVTEDESGKRRLEDMKWGIPRSLGKDFVKEIINTRSDKAFGGFWKRTVLGSRCLVPSTGFYEWKRSDGSKTPYFVHPKKMDLYAFAGIWDKWKNKDGKEVRVFSIMTTEPNKEMRDVHDRMPVILQPEDEQPWLDPANDSPDALSELLFPLPDNSLEIYEIGRAVNNPRNNDKSLLAPV